MFDKNTKRFVQMVNVSEQYQPAMEAFSKEGFYPKQVYYIVNDQELDVLVAFVEDTLLVYTPMWSVKVIDMGPKTLSIKYRSLRDVRHAFSHANIEFAIQNLITKIDEYNVWLSVVGDAIAVYAPERKPEVRFIILNS